MGIYSDFYKLQQKEKPTTTKKGIYSTFYELQKQKPKTQKIMTSDQIIKKSPIIQEVTKDLPKTGEVSRFRKRFLDSTSFGISGEIDKKFNKDVSYREARSFKDDALGASLDWAATLAGYAVPGLGWAKAGKALLSLPKTSKIAKSIFAQNVPKGTKNRIVKKIKEQAKEGLIAGAAFAGAEVGGREAINPDDYSAKDNLKTLGIGALSGLVADPLVYGGIKGISKLANKIKKTPEAEQLVKQADEITQEAKKIEPEIKKNIEEVFEKTPEEADEVLKSQPAGVAKLTKGEQTRQENIEKNKIIEQQSKQAGIEFDVNSVGMSGTKKQEKTDLGNIKTQAKNLQTNIFDTNAPLKDLPSKEIYENKADTVRANSLATQTNEKAFVDIEGNVVGKAYQKILEPVKNRLDELDNLLISRHAVSRMEKGDEVFNEQFKINNNATPEGIKAGIKKYEADPNNKAIVEAANEIDNFTKNLRNLLIKEKIWTKELADALEKDYPHYVPLLREFDEETSTSIMKRVKKGGSTRDILSPIKTFEEQIRLYYTFILNNRTNQALLNSIKKNKDTYKQLGIEIVEESKIGKTLDPQELEDVIIESEKALMKQSKKDKFVYAIEDGIKYKIKVDDPKIYDALALIPEQDKSIAIGMVEKLNRALKRSATGILAPVWTTGGLFYDTTIALFKAKDPIQHFGYLIGSLIGSLPKSEKFAPNLAKMAESFYLGGGGFNSILKSPSMFRTAVERSGLRKVGEFFIPFDEKSFWGRFQQYFENVNRIAAFNTELKRLGGQKTPENIRKAMEYARKITTDYSVRGKWAIEAEKYFPFTTASLAGVSQNLKFSFNNPMKAVAGIGLGVLTPALYEYSRFYNDPEYDKINKREKYRNIYYGKDEQGRFLKIPIDPQLGFIKQMFINSFEAYGEQDPDTFKGAMEELSQIYLPPPVSGLLKPVTDKQGKITDVISNTSLAPFAAVWSNKGYAGIPIVPKEYELMQVEEKFKYNENTTKIATTLGKLTGFNPFKIDYIIKTYTGDFGRILMPLISEKGLQVGGTIKSEQLLRKFITNTTFSNNLSEQFYTGKRLLNEAKKESEITGKEPPEWYDERMYRILNSQANNSVSKVLSILKDLERSVSLDKSLSKEQREEALKKIAEQRNIIFINYNSYMKSLGIPLTTKR